MKLTLRGLTNKHINNNFTLIQIYKTQIIYFYLILYKNNYLFKRNIIK